jgi:hypothetical protein
VIVPAVRRLLGADHPARARWRSATRGESVSRCSSKEELRTG